MTGYKNKAKKLVLNTETLRNLQDADLRQVVGGAGENIPQRPSAEAGSGCVAVAFGGRN